MADIYVTIEHEIPEKELFRFHHLAKLWNKTLQETVEICMFEKRDEYIDQFENNVPSPTETNDDNDRSTDKDTTTKPTEGTEERPDTN